MEPGDILTFILKSTLYKSNESLIPQQQHLQSGGFQISLNLFHCGNKDIRVILNVLLMKLIALMFIGFKYIMVNIKETFAKGITDTANLTTVQWKIY